MDDEMPSMEQYCQYLAYALVALARRLSGDGGEVIISREEIWRAIDTSATFDREDEDLVIKLGPVRETEG